MTGDEPIFAEALALRPEERAAFLDRACAGDPARRERIAGLLEAHAEPERLEPMLRERPPAVPAEAPGDVLGRYKLLQKIGEGGCGVVWMAQQEDPVRRRVALKVIKLGMDTKSVVARFDAERQALAIMDHPGIAKVLDAGATAVGRPYFVMELVRGVPLTKFCDEHQVSPRERLELFIKVCHAIQHAHQKGIIHRDIKPSNILVSMNDGVAVPKVIDFGIAKATQGRLTDATLFTAFEQFMGTPAYMSPEQAEMTSLDVDTRSDVYSLGVLLYELLTGRTPFDTQALLKAGVDEIRRVIRESNPPLPSRRLSTLSDGDRAAVAKFRGTGAAELHGLLRGDLDWIAMRCLEKDRSRRYDTANSLAEDIRRHLDNRPVVARPPSTAYLFQKLIRRNRLAFAAGLVIALVVVVGSIVSVGLAIRARQSEHAAEARAQDARHASYTAEMNLAQHALSGGNLSEASRLIAKYVPNAGDTDLRGFEWRYLAQQLNSTDSDLVGSFSGDRLGMAVSPDGGFVAAASAQSIEVRSLPSGRIVRTLPVATFAGAVQFSPDGRWLYSVFRRSVQSGTPRPAELRRWSTETWAESPPVAGIAPPFAVTPAGVLVGVDDSGGLETWDTTTWAKTGTLAGEGGWGVRLSSIVVARDGRTAFVAGDIAFGIRSWDLVSLAELPALFLPFRAGTRALAVGLDGMLAAAHDNGAVSAWNSETRRRISVYEEHTGPAGAVAFSSDGQTLATAGDDQRIVLHDLAGRSTPRRLSGHRGAINALAFAAGSRSLLSASNDDNAIRRWTIVPVDEEANVLKAFLAFEFSPRSDGLTAWSSQDGFISFDLPSRTRHPLPFRAPTGVAETEFSYIKISTAAGRMAYIRGRTLVVSNLATGTEEKVLTPDQGSFSYAAFSQDGRYLAASGTPSGVWLWELPSWRAEKLGGPAGTGTGRLAFSRDGRLLAAMTKPKLLVFDLAAGGRPLELPAAPYETGDPAFSPDGRTLAVAQTGENGEVIKIYRLDDPTGVPDILSGHLGRIRGIAFSPDGRTLASGGDDFMIKLWSMENHLEVLTLPSRRVQSRAVMFSADGQWLAADSTDDILQLWHAPLAR